MPPLTTFSRETLVNAAFKILRSKGRDRLTARSLARELHCSTMPIYSYLKSMKKLEGEMAEKAIKLQLEYQAQPRTGRIFFDMGLGYIMFARNEKHLFRFLFSDHKASRGRNRVEDRLAGMAFGNLVPMMKSDPTLAGLDSKQLESILTKMWIFTHGLAMLVNNGLLARDDEEYLQQSLYEMGDAVITAEQRQLINPK